MSKHEKISTSIAWLAAFGAPSYWRRCLLQAFQQVHQLGLLLYIPEEPETGAALPATFGIIILQGLWTNTASSLLLLSALGLTATSAKRPTQFSRGFP